MKNWHCKKLILSVIACLVLAACVSGKITKQPDGACSAEFTSVLKSAESVNLCGAKAENSQAKTELVGELLQALLSK